MEVMETIGTEKIQKQETQVRELYERTFPYVARLISRMGGSFDDARDLFHDSLVIYYELTFRDHSRVQTSEEAYITGIAKHLWIRKHERDRQIVPMNEFEREIPVPDDYFPSVEKKRLLRIIETAGRKCMELLHAFYYRRDKVKEIAASLGYANDHSLSVQKYKCLDKVRNVIKEKSLRYEDFLE